MIFRNIIFFSLTILNAHAQNLPVELPANYIQTQNFQKFTPHPKGVRAPFGANIVFNGIAVPVGDQTKLESIFVDDILAQIPAGTKIQNNQTAWDFPVGTEVAHWIRLKGKVEVPFEFRIIRKLPGASWDFGSYTPLLDGNGRLLKFKRNSYTGLEPYSAQYQGPQGQAQTVTLGRINLRSCQNCHMMTSDAPYHSIQEVGPCSFVPQNEERILCWAERFQKKTGFYPLQAQPNGRRCSE